MQTLIKELSSRNLIIAIDGYAACGKSTLAKALAAALDYRYIDSGAMYRAVTLYFIRKGISTEDHSAVQEAMASIDIDFSRVSGSNHTFLNGEDVEQAIRTPEVNDLVSRVAAITTVRRKLVEQQQKMGRSARLVMDGRDIGTVVFPEADLKLFVTADIDIRTQRRLTELESKGIEVSFDRVKHNLQERDRIDTSRADSPLVQAVDARVLDTTRLTPHEQLQEAIRILAQDQGVS